MGDAPAPAVLQHLVRDLSPAARCATQSNARTCCRWGGGLSLGDTIEAMRTVQADVVGIQEPRTRKPAFGSVLSEVAGQ